MSKIILTGIVQSGKGDGKKFIKKPWVKKQIFEKLGFDPYLGTLNLKLDPPSISLRKILEQTPTFEIYPSEGFCVGLIYVITFKKIKSAIILPQVVNYPDELLEIIAPVNLRERFQLSNGDSLSIPIFL